MRVVVSVGKVDLSVLSFTSLPFINNYFDVACDMCYVSSVCPLKNVRKLIRHQKYVISIFTRLIEIFQKCDTGFTSIAQTHSICYRQNVSTTPFNSLRIDINLPFSSTDNWLQ